MLVRKKPSKMHVSVISILLCCSVSAHFEMTNPAPRTVGTMASQKIFPCAGAASPSANRVAYSAINSTIELTFYWDGDNDIMLGLGENPSKFPFKIGALKGAKMGDTYSVPVELSKVPGWKMGEPATIQAVCHQPSFDIYQCVDVVMDVSGPSDSSTLSASSSSTSSPSPQPTNPAPVDTQARVQKLADSLIEHISGPNGCGENKDDMPQDSLSTNLAALWLRAAFHDVGKWEKGKIVSGLLPTFVDERENMGIARSLTTLFAPNRIFNFSRSDKIALGGLVTVGQCGGPVLDFQAGRTDAIPAETTFGSLKALPDDFLDTYDVIKSKLQRLGFNNEDIVALVTGSHSLGGVHQKISPHATNLTFEAFDETPSVFDNNVFKQSLKGICRLRVDCAIAKDPELRQFVEKFANDQQAFFKQYALSFAKMTSLGQSNLMDAVHLSIPGSPSSPSTTRGPAGSSSTSSVPYGTPTYNSVYSASIATGLSTALSALSLIVMLI